MGNNQAQTNKMETEGSSIEIYRSEEGGIELNVRLQGETVWLSRQQMAELFQTDRTSILKHINNIYKSEELKEEATCAKFAQVRREGKREVTRQIPFYNLDMVISVGYRVNSKRGTQFRIWANNVLRQYLIKGYAVNNKLSGNKRIADNTLVALTLMIAESRMEEKDQIVAELEADRPQHVAVTTKI